MPTDVRATGKSRSQRINIDYYRRRNWLTRSRALLALLAGTLASAYCLYVFSTGTTSHLSTGPVVSAHASFEDDCQQCHLDFTPISADAIQFVSAQSLDRQEEACQKCHRVDHHFRSSLDAKHAAIDQHCASCHHDHLGRDHDMVAISNNQCVQCHSELPATCNSQSSISVRGSVTGFSIDAHGDFLSLKQGDPGRIKFDHSQHMMPGQVNPGIKGGFRIDMLEPEARERYRKNVNGNNQPDDSLVTLACIDCHAFDGASKPLQVGDNEIGRHIAPISFDQHCAACHSLNAIGRQEDTLPLPHAAPWKEIETLVASKLIGSQQIRELRMPRDAAGNSLFAGEGNETTDTKTVSSDPNSKEYKAILEETIRTNLSAITSRCLQCHLEDDITDNAIRSLRSNQSQPLIPSRWLKRGIYDHAAHSKMDCSFCHPQAYPSVDKMDSGRDDSEIVMIGGIETCVGCHRDSSTPFQTTETNTAAVQAIGGQGTWASDKCVECHRYHWQRPTLPEEKAIETSSLTALEPGP